MMWAAGESVETGYVSLVQGSEGDLPPVLPSQNQLQSFISLPFCFVCRPSKVRLRDNRVRAASNLLVLFPGLVQCEI